MATILVTGGAGFVGAHACKALRARAHVPVTFDNFATGWRGAVRYGPVVEGDLLDPRALDAALADTRPDGVMHFAALSNVGESADHPGHYWRNNVCGTLNLVDAMRRHGVGPLVFSSTCATYGEAKGDVLVETDAQVPVNPYGRTKLAVERMIGDVSAAAGSSYLIFRYFNAAGADPDREIGECHQPETHLIPLALDAALGRRAELTIHGSDYPTADGTCIRDYVHVGDLADAHVLGMEHLLRGGPSLALNLGSGRGHSVREVIEAIGRVTGLAVPVVDGPHRPGDPPRLVSGSDRARSELDWSPRRSSLERMVGAWHQAGRWLSG